MLQKLKHSGFGKLLYRLSRTSLGAPLRHLARALQHDALNPAHFSARNRAHNRAQVQILERFEAQNNSVGK